MHTDITLTAALLYLNPTTERLLSFVLLEVKRDTVDAMPLIRRSLVSLSLEDMSKMTTTVNQLDCQYIMEYISLPVGTSDLDAGHEHRLVLVSVDSSGDRIKERRPSAS